MPPSLARLVALHSLTWLVVANTVGIWLGLLLVVPRLGDGLAPLTYGRWVPVHLELQLYGWCALPLVGLLLRWYLPADRSIDRWADRWAAVALALWSLSLLAGAASWLAGGSSGKLFLEWSGTARWLLLIAQSVLAGTLARAFVERLRAREHRDTRWALWARGLALPGLMAVPAVLFWATRPDHYPPVNPDSGGATGGSLLGSTLGIVALLVLLPFLLGLRPADGGRVSRHTVAALMLHGIGFALLDHGDRSHHEPLEVIALASVAIWVPLLARHLRRFTWSHASRPWLAALLAWSITLVISGVVTFLPGILEQWKFTNALTAHAHIAMAGLVTCLNVLVLQGLLRKGLPRDEPGADPFANRRSFVLWHGGNVIMAIALLTLGTLEGADPSLLFRDSAIVTTLYTVRLAAGVAMVVAAWSWWRGASATGAAHVATSRVCATEVLA